MPPRTPPAIPRRKLALMGAANVGKSSLTLQFVTGQFPESYNPSIEDTHEKTYDFRSKRYQLEILDTAGQHEYSLFPRSCQRVDIQGFLLVYSIDSRKSLDIVRVIREKILDNFNENIPIVLVGNKNDLRHQRVVPFEEGKQFADDWKVEFLECSAQEAPQVKQVFERILYEIEKSLGNIKPEPSNGGKNCTIS